ncbi:MAG: hypothetical protein K9N46_00880 [Candidatus Marinimicrobia bacterium]|nr:hypothetical protein [Candidatus Neomarinimicrobiota bacterium]MCF7827969.1 hypothetical protein [Candidatus Neomarinimicrobiota bacterium]MCF7879276.1 hypothetical protein [Candidatus Neomarinimicrobiota bacterium]
MTTLTNRTFLSAVLVFILFHGLDALGVSIPVGDGFFRAYLDDFLCLPILLTFVLYIHRKYRVKSENYRLPILHTVLAFVIIGMAFEIIYPFVSTQGTADILDLLAYGGGGIIFDQWINVV